MTKKLVVLSGTWYPLTMMHYFLQALRRREDVELITTGPYTGGWIPWKGGMTIDPRHIYTPTYPLPAELINPPGYASPDVIDSIIATQVKRVPDVWIQLDAGFYFNPRPKAKIVLHVATDPHCLLYNIQRGQCDIFFNMQKSYLQAGDSYLPYAYDPVMHRYNEAEKIYEGCLIGAIYPDRLKLLKELHDRGFNVFSDTGIVFNDYTAKYNQSKVALNISSLQDVNARTFEAMGMKVPLLTNRLPSLTFHFKEDVHYKGFDTVSEASHQFRYMVARENEEEMKAMAEAAYLEVSQHHTWDMRITQMFTEAGLE